ncbi:MAG: hypothetical protein Q4B43_09530 [Bacteroidota bacterium]|nr:hypothetical protein [Bacteroidota bacterium]
MKKLYKVKYLIPLFIFSCNNTETIGSEEQYETIEFVINDKVVLEKSKTTNVFYLKSKDTVCEVGTSQFVHFDIGDTLILVKDQYGNLYLKSHRKAK